MVLLPRIEGARLLAWSRNLGLFLLGVVALVAARIWLTSDILVVAHANAGYDDNLFVDMAREVLDGGWFGSYDKHNLIKGVFYPYFLAVVHALGLPLMAAHQGLYVLACVAFLAAILRYLPNRYWGLLVFAVLLFNPVSYTESVVARPIRDSIYPSLALLLIAASARLALAAEAGERPSRPWAWLAGLSLAAFWLIRQEGIWIVPTVAVPLLYAAFVAIRRGDFDRDYRRVLMIPILVPVAAVLLVSLVNLAAYGVFRMTDMESNAFRDAYGALSRIRVENRAARVPVSREARDKAYSVSPTFATLRAALEGPGLRGFRTTGMANGQIDFGGGHFLWAIREAVFSQVGSKHAGTVDDYFRRIADEVDAACDSGALDCGPRRSGFMPPWNEGYTQALPGTFLETLRRIVTFHWVTHRIDISSGTDKNMQLFRRVLIGDFTPTVRDILGERTVIGGWAVSHLGPVSFRLVDSKNREFPQGLRQGLPSVGLFEAQSHVPGLRKEWTESARFMVDTVCELPCYLDVVIRGERVARIPLDGTVISLVRSDFRMHLDVHIPPSLQDGARKRDAFTKYYIDYTPWLAGLALLCYLFITVRMIVRKRIDGHWIVLSVLLGTVLARAVVISVVHVTSFDAMNTQYLSPAFPPGLAFVALAPILVFLRKPTGAKV